MPKTLFAFLIGVTLNLLVVGGVLAADLNVRVEEPKSPANQDTFNINFVALDIQGRSVTVRCYKKGPSDGSFSQFGSDINLAAGGSTGNCSVNSSIVSTKGSYEFYVTAQAGSDSATSATVKVDFDNSSPDTPVSYKKEQHESCKYTILFKTAPDSGKTVKVEIYRSDKTEFDVNSSSRVGSVNIGSDSEGSFLDTVPDCNKQYYYVIRAFNSVGNGSGTIGDSAVKKITVEISPTGAPSQGGALPVAQSGVSPAGGEVLGEGAGAKAGAKKEGEALSEEVTPSAEVKAGEAPSEAGPSQIFSRRNILIGGVALLILLGIYYFYRRSQGAQD